MSYKTLYILRHAKAVPGGATLEDRDRPLNERGNRDAERMGHYFRDESIRPRLTLCSTSARTRQTLAQLEKGLGSGLETEFAETLYLASPGEVLNRLYDVPDMVDSVLLVGHNEGFHQLATRLAGSGELRLRDAVASEFPTCALAELRFPVTRWDEVQPGGGELVRFAVAKELAPA